MLSYWTFSDVFEEQGVVKQPFYGGYGLIAEDGVPKPSFNAFKLLHKLGEQRIAAGSESALVTRRPDGNICHGGMELVPARRDRKIQRRHDPTVEADGELRATVVSSGFDSRIALHRLRGNGQPKPIPTPEQFGRTSTCGGAACA